MRIKHYVWDIGNDGVPDTITSTGYITTAVKGVVGSFEIRLTVSDMVGVETERIATITFAPENMLFIDSCQFSMGMQHDSASLPLRNVILSGYYIDKREISQDELSNYLSHNPSVIQKNPAYPAENVTWFDVALFCNNRSKAFELDTIYSYTQKLVDANGICTSLTNLQINIQKMGFRLPTEAEWENACRAGTSTDFFWGSLDTKEIVQQYACIRYLFPVMDPEYGETCRIGSLEPNQYGLFDMAGNVREWCQDWHGPYQSVQSNDPTGPSDGWARVVRGGCYNCDVEQMRSGHREKLVPTFGIATGFRCVLPLRKK